MPEVSTRELDTLLDKAVQWRLERREELAKYLCKADKGDDVFHDSCEEPCGEVSDYDGYDKALADFEESASEILDLMADFREASKL